MIFCGFVFDTVVYWGTMKRNLMLGLALGLLNLGSLPIHAKTAPVVIWCNSQTDEKYYRDMVRVYQSKVDPKFEAEIRSYGFTEMPDKLAIAIKTGINPPDIVQLDEIYISLYLAGKVPFVDLTDRIKAAGLDRSILPQRQGLFTWKGRNYGVAQSTSNVVLYYREDLFKELNITPRMLDTWEKFEEVGRKIKTDTRSLIALDWSYFEILMRQRGYDVFDTEGNPLPDSAIAVETLNRITGWRKERIGLIPDRGTIFEPEFFSSYVANNGVLSIMSADWYGLDMIKNFDPKHAGKWKAMPLPVWTDSLSRGRNTTSNFSGQGLVIFKKSKQVDRSWAFMKWVMTDVDANVERFLQGNCFTPFTPSWTDLRFNQVDPYFGGQSLSSLIMELAPKSPMARQSPYRAQLVNLFRERYWSSVVSGSTPAGQAVSEIRQMILHPAPATPAPK
jgi:ABC-type glycerol-3-phosphate transport system substrate-binding protein